MPADSNLCECKHDCSIHNILSFSGLDNARSLFDSLGILRSLFLNRFRLLFGPDVDRFRCADLDTLRLSPTEVTVIRYISKDV
jgi:hypothetical protein